MHIILKYAYYSQNIFLAVFASDCTIKLFIKSSKITQKRLRLGEKWRNTLNKKTVKYN